MEYKFEKNKMDLQVLREFCKREGEAVEYRKGDQLEREGSPARWFGYVKLRAVIAEHILFQFRSRYLDLHCATARERYELLLQRCPGIVEHLDLQDLASFLCITPNYLSTIRK